MYPDLVDFIVKSAKSADSEPMASQGVPWPEGADSDGVVATYEAALTQLRGAAKAKCQTWLDGAKMNVESDKESGWKDILKMTGAIIPILAILFGFVKTCVTLSITVEKLVGLNLQLEARTDKLSDKVENIDNRVIKLETKDEVVRFGKDLVK